MCNSFPNIDIIQIYFILSFSLHKRHFIKYWFSIQTVIGTFDINEKKALKDEWTCAVFILNPDWWINVMWTVAWTKTSLPYDIRSPMTYEPTKASTGCAGGGFINGWFYNLQCLQTTTHYSDGKRYLQVEGTAMGFRLAPSLCNDLHGQAWKQAIVCHKVCIHAYVGEWESVV